MSTFLYSGKKTCWNNVAIWGQHSIMWSFTDITQCPTYCESIYQKTASTQSVVLCLPSGEGKALNLHHGYTLCMKWTAGVDSVVSGPQLVNDPLCQGWWHCLLTRAPIQVDGSKLSNHDHLIFQPDIWTTNGDECLVKHQLLNVGLFLSVNLRNEIFVHYLNRVAGSSTCEQILVYIFWKNKICLSKN